MWRQTSLYEGPYCVLSVVDNRQYKRILYAVLDHDPTHPDIIAFLGYRFKPGHPAPSSTCRDGLTALPGPGQLVDL